MYKCPGSDAMTFGFWRKDPAIVGQNWYKPAKFHPIPTSEMSRYIPGIFINYFTFTHFLGMLTQP